MRVQALLATLLLSGCSALVSLEGLSGKDDMSLDGGANDGSTDATTEADPSSGFPSNGMDASSDAPTDASADAPQPSIASVSHTSVDLGCGAAVTNGTISLAHVSAGNLVIVGVKKGNVTASITDSQGNSWSVANPTVSATITIQTWYAVAKASGPMTASLTFGGPTTCARMFALEYTGVTTLDRHSEAVGTGGNATSGPLITTAPRELLFAICDEGSCGQTPPPGFTQREAPAPPGTTGCNVVSDRIVSVAGTYEAACALSVPSDPWATVLATFR